MINNYYGGFFLNSLLGKYRNAGKYHQSHILPLFILHHQIVISFTYHVTLSDSASSLVIPFFLYDHTT